MKKETFKPVLACDYDANKAKFPMLALAKIDGVRALVVKDRGLVGRSLKPFKNKALTALLSRPELTGLEGELVVGDITGESVFRDTNSLVSTINGSVDGLQWLVFDDNTDPTLPYAQRYYNAHRRVQELPEPLRDVVVMVPANICETHEQATAMYDAFLELGYEGMILRDPAAAYKFGRATAKEGSYLRMKPSSDDEAVVLSLEEAEANNNDAVVNELGLTERSSHQENKEGKGMLGALICRDLKTGSEIKVGAGKMNHDERVIYWNQPDLIVGKTIKYRHLTTGVKDKPRHARFIGFRAEEDMSE